jgi:hypothetical protein
MNSLQLFAVTIILLLAAWFAAAQLESIAGMALCILAALIVGMRALVRNHHEHTR